MTSLLDFAEKNPTALVTVLIAIATALATIAYRHPEAYRRIFYPLFIVATGIFWFLAGNTRGMLAAVDQLLDADIDPATKLKIVKPLTESIYLNSWAYGYAFFSAYLILLFFFPLIFREKYEADFQQKATEKRPE